MNIAYAGVTFNVSYRAASRGSWNEPPESAEIEIHDWHVSDWDELAICHGAKGLSPIIRRSLNEIVDAIIDREYDGMLDQAEQEVRDSYDFEPDFEPPEWDDIMGELD
jgi:hypothetical protein